MAIITVEIEVFESVENITKINRADWFQKDQIIIDGAYLTCDPEDDSFYLFTPIAIRNSAEEL